MAPKGHLAPRLPKRGAQRAKLGETGAVRSQQRQISRVGFEGIDAPCRADGEGRPNRVPAQIGAGVYHYGAWAKGRTKKRAFHPFPGAIPAQQVADQFPWGMKRKGPRPFPAPRRAKAFPVHR